MLSPARFDAVDWRACVDCPTLVCVGELDPVTRVTAQQIYDGLPAGTAWLEMIEGLATSRGRTGRPDRYWPLPVEFVKTVGAR